MTLDEYFKLIVKPTEKEPTMFDVIKAKWAEFWTTRYVFNEPLVHPSPKAYLEFRAEMEKAKQELNTMLVTPVEEEQEEDCEEGWAFVMRTDSYINEDGEFIPMKETIIAGDNNGTWMESLDQLLDVFSEHYGYDIKEQVYYSVFMPLNIEGEAGFGRCLNDEVLQKLLLSYPEVYDFKGHIEQ